MATTQKGISKIAANSSLVVFAVIFTLAFYPFFVVAVVHCIVAAIALSLVQDDILAFVLRLLT